MNNYITHSAAGTHWKKKNAKYIRKEGNRYIYADGSSTSSPAQPQVQQHISVPKNLKSTQGVTRTVMKSTPKNYEANLAKSSAPKNNQGISKYATAADRHTKGEETKEVTAADRTSAKQKAAARTVSSGGVSTTARRKDEINYNKKKPHTFERSGQKSYDPDDVYGKKGPSVSLPKSGSSGSGSGSRNSKLMSMTDILKARSEQNNVEGTISNSASKPKEIDSPDIGKESINGLIASGNRTLNAGFDAVSKFFKKKA